MTTFCFGVCIVTWLSGMVSGLYWKFIHYTIDYSTFVVLSWLQWAGQGGGGAVRSWHLPGWATCTPARQVASCSSHRFLNRAEMQLLNRIFSRVKPAQTQVFFWFSTLVFLRSTKFYSWKLSGFLFLIFIKYGFLNQSRVWFLVKSAAKEVTVNRTEQKTRVFCQIDVHEFHLWRHAQ